MDKARVLAHILGSKVKTTLLGGEPLGSVINSKKYVPACAHYKSVDYAIHNALASETRSAVLKGPEGSGKTTALQNLAVGWAKGECLQNFSYVFHFNFRQINHLEGELFLETLIQHNCYQVQPGAIAEVTEKPEDVLFVFDGLDVYKHSLDPLVHTLCSDPNQPVSVSCLVASLLHRSLLRGAAFLVATRPTENTSFLSCTEVSVLGFLEPQREDFFNSFFTDPSEANKALLHMERTLGFYKFCASPRFCWTVCSMYRSLFDSGGRLPETLSELFVDILIHLIEKISVSETSNRELVLALGRMASHCFLHQHPISTKEDIDSFGFQPFLTSSELFLRVEPEPESEACVFSFHSQLMQEFVLAVAFYLDRSKYRGVEKMLENQERGAKFLDFFLSGLSEPAQSGSLEILVGGFDTDQVQDFKSWFKCSSQEMLQHDDEKKYRGFDLLHQAQNESLVKEMCIPLEHPCIYHSHLRVQDCVALAYVITCLGQRETIFLSDLRMEREIMEVLSPAVSLSRTVILKIHNLQIEAVSLLASAVSTGVTQYLNVTTDFDDEKFKVLCAGLKGSKLNRLYLHCGITAARCNDLVSLLTSETSQLQNLEIMYNSIMDLGFTKLCEAMHSPHCQLQELQIEDCELTAASMEPFAAALCSGQSQLRKVDLTDDCIGDPGVEAICKALQHPLCKLQSLQLRRCELTGACCSHLKEALLSEHCCLSELDLSLNELGQEGALQLLQGLSRPGCPMESLSLGKCELTSALFEKLGSLLKSGTCQIKSLLMGLNKVGDEGVKPLWDAVAHPSCLLEELHLQATGFTDACVEDLCAAVRANKTLKVLELGNNSLTDASVPALVQLMQDKPNMEINLESNEDLSLSLESNEDLSLSSNSSVEEMQ